MTALGFIFIILSFSAALLKFLNISGVGQVIENHTIQLTADLNSNQMNFVGADLGLLLALIFFYRKELREIFSAIIPIIRGEKTEHKDKPVAFILMFSPIILLNFIRTVTNFRFGLYGYLPPIAIYIIPILVLIILFFCDRKNSPEKNKISLKDALIIGLTQLSCLILTPYSRAELSLAVMRYKGYSRLNSFKYFALLSVPLLIYSCGSQINNIIYNYQYPAETAINSGMPFAVSALSFLISLALLNLVNRFLKKCTMIPWIIYRISFIIMSLAYCLTVVKPEMNKLIIPRS